MTPQQKVDYMLKVVKDARQQQFTREQFVTVTNRLWDALDGAETDAGAVQQTLRLENANGNPIS
jgi:hypothetical protein